MYLSLIYFLDLLLQCDDGLQVILPVDLPATLLIRGAGVGHGTIHLNAVGAGHILVATAGIDPTLLVTVTGHIHHTTTAVANHTPGLLTVGPLQVGEIGHTHLMILDITCQITDTMEDTIITRSPVALPHRGGEAR